MIDLIVFNVGENRYSMNIANVQRIIQATDLTSIPNAHENIDGMMSYEDRVIKVLNFRKLINMDTYENELKLLFTDLKVGHANWVDALRKSIETGCEFTKTFDPHACALGKWIDSFTAYDDHVVLVLNELTEFHKQLHTTGARAIEIYKHDRKDEALQILNVDIVHIYEQTMGALDTFVKELDLVANSLQKLIIYENDVMPFAIKVDSIEDIAHIREDVIIPSSKDETRVNEFLELEGVLDLKGVLINVIKTIKLPK
jgi:chemotaxis signal transduction protein